MKLGGCCSIKTAQKIGTYKRKYEPRPIQRYRCKTCKKTFSEASFEPEYQQKKRWHNETIMMMLSSTMSIRRIAVVLKLNRKTVARKLEFLGRQARENMARTMPDYTDVTAIQFDELQTTEHSKCKPLSVAMAVSENSRKILGFTVSVMPATGHLAKIARKKYGFRRDDRRQGLTALFKHLRSNFDDTLTFRSDECLYYQPILKRYFPKSTYHQFKGEKSAISAQGELKKVVQDPLFWINHTFAMLRANINRLIRKTWCTTKQRARLIDHISIYAWVHNSILTS